MASANGTVKRKISDKGFGFIAAGDGKEYFFHQSACTQTPFDALREGDTVSFEVGRGSEGPARRKRPARLGKPSRSEPPARPPAFTSLYSKACREGQSGELLGQGQAMSTTGRIVGPLLGGWIMARWGPAAPFLAAGALMALALALFWSFRALLVDGEDH